MKLVKRKDEQKIHLIMGNQTIDASQVHLYDIPPANCIAGYKTNIVHTWNYFYIYKDQESEKENARIAEQEFEFEIPNLPIEQLRLEGLECLLGEIESIKLPKIVIINDAILALPLCVFEKYERKFDIVNEDFVHHMREYDIPGFAKFMVPEFLTLEEKKPYDEFERMEYEIEKRFERKKVG